MTECELNHNHRLNEALEKSEELCHAIFDHASVGIAQLAPDGSWLLVNGKICQILGYTIDELGDVRVEELGHPEDRAMHAADLRRILSGEVSCCSEPKRCLRKDGSTVWVNLTVTLVRDGTGEPEYFIAVMEDINVWKRAEEELKKSEEKFRQIFRLAPIAITISTLADGRFVDFNESAERLSGYSRDEVVGHFAHEFSVWKSTQERTDMIREVVTRGEVRDREMVMKDKAGRTFWGLFSAVVIEIRGEKYLLSLVSDIGERKRAQEAIRESEERFRLVADNAPVLIWEAGEDAGCTFVNKSWLDFTGRSLEQELGLGWTESIHPDDAARCVDTYLTAFREGKEFSLEYRLRRSSGEYGWIVDSGVPRVGKDGQILGYIGTGFDITDLRRAKEELQQANRHLAQRVEERTAELTATIDKLQQEIDEKVRIGQALQDETSERMHVEAELREKELLLLHQGRLAAMGEMIGNIAHQWKQPLNLLALIAQEMPMTWKTGGFSEEYLEKSVKKMRETIQHMSQTVGDFSNFFKPSKERVFFRVLDTVEKTISLLEGSLKAHQIRCEVVAECDPVVNGYPNELSQVFLNIMINARDALVENGAPDPTITIAAVIEGGRCVVTITDNAGGIPEEILSRIFEPYFTTKPPDKGTGVGLFMSRTIVEKNMGGRLSAHNVPGGAQFRIELDNAQEKGG